MDRLVLFDIDGTILTTDGAAARAFRRALGAVYGAIAPIENHSFAGKTDPQIAVELLSAAGLSQADIEAGLPELWEAYLRQLPRELAATAVNVYPGVISLLDRLESGFPRARLGLLTGNLAEGARLKLTAAFIDFGRFSVGAFGSDHERREELPGIAVERARARFGQEFSGKEIVIIGDTPHDIACGERLGVHTIAVATGAFSVEELARCGPDHLFDSLADVERVIEAIFER